MYISTGTLIIAAFVCIYYIRRYYIMNKLRNTKKRCYTIVCKTTQRIAISYTAELNRFFRYTYHIQTKNMQS